MRTLYISSDEGSFLCGAARILHGQVFARDFFEVMGPGTFYWMAAFFKLFGVTFLAARICLFIPLLGTALTIYFLSRHVCIRYPALPCLILGGPYFGLLGQVESHHVDSNFFALLSIACLVLWHRSRRKSLVIAAGALAGITTCFLQPKGILLFCAILVWFCFQNRRISLSLPWIGLATGSYISIVALVLGYFWSQGGLRNLVYVNYIFPSQHYAAINSVVYAQGIIEGWMFWMSQQNGLNWPWGVAALFTAPSLFIAALPVLLLVLGLRCKFRSQQTAIVLYTLGGTAIWLSELHRKDIHHLTYGSPLLVILSIHLLGEIREKIIYVAVQVLAICAVCLAIFSWLVATAIHSVPTRVGTVAAFGAGSASVLAFLNTHVQPGEDTFIYPYSPAYYFLSATANPTPYSFLTYGYNTPSQFQEVVRILDQRRVRYVVWDTNFLSKTAEEVFSGSMPKSPRDLIIEPYLESHYRLIQDDHGIRIMERKREDNTK